VKGFVSLNLRLKDLLGPVRRVKKKKKVNGLGFGVHTPGVVIRGTESAVYRVTSLIRNSPPP